MASVCLVSHALHLSLNFQWQWPPSPIDGTFVSQAPYNCVTFVIPAESIVCFSLASVAIFVFVWPLYDRRIAA